MFSDIQPIVLTEKLILQLMHVILEATREQLQEKYPYETMTAREEINTCILQIEQQLGTVH